jgi:uncharacterized lipoprotein YajG
LLLKLHLDIAYSFTSKRRSDHKRRSRFESSVYSFILSKQRGINFFTGCLAIAKAQINPTAPINESQSAECHLYVAAARQRHDKEVASYSEAIG